MSLKRILALIAIALFVAFFIVERVELIAAGGIFAAGAALVDS